MIDSKGKGFYVDTAIKWFQQETWACYDNWCRLVAHGPKEKMQRLCDLLNDSDVTLTERLSNA